MAHHHAAMTHHANGNHRMAMDEHAVAHNGKRL